MNRLVDDLAALIRKFKQDPEYRTCVQIELCKLELEYVRTFVPYTKSDAGTRGGKKLSSDNCHVLLDSERQRISRNRALFNQFTDYEIARVYRTAEQRLKDPKSLLRAILNERARQAREAELAQVEAKQSYTIMESTCQGLINQIEPQSVDVIFTDPPYNRHEVKDAFHELGLFARHALKDTGVLVSYTGFFIDPLIELHKHLTWYAPLVITGLTRGKVPQGYAYQIQHKQVVVFVPQSVPDYSYYRLNNGLSLIQSTVPVSDALAGRSVHHWEQDIATAKLVLEQFVLPEHSLIDPFAGSGAFLKAAALLGLNDIRGFDNDPVHCTEWVN